MVGMAAQPEYPSLEALLEAEAGQPDQGYFLAARIVPPSGLAIALGIFLPLGLYVHPLFHIGTVVFSLLAVGAWFLFDSLDRAITSGKKQIRKKASVIWSRYGGFGNLVGVEPVLSETVGEVLDEAAAIYLKHSGPGGSPRATNEAYLRAHQALEFAMAKLLDLAVVSNVRSQELEFEAGWALPLLREMRQMDDALTRLAQYASHATLPLDPLANLRDARAELTGVVSAIDELEQRHSR